MEGELDGSLVSPTLTFFGEGALVATLTRRPLTTMMFSMMEVR